MGSLVRIRACALSAIIKPMERKFFWLIVALIVISLLGVAIYIYLPLRESQFPATALIVYTDNGFEPSVITSKSNITITFRNDSSKAFQPVSDRGYEGYRCLNNEFGACQPIPPGGTWSAQFDIAAGGGWPYHDALNPSAKVDITVIVPTTGWHPYNDNPL